MHARNFLIGVLLATVVLVPASASAKTANETMLGLQAQIEALLAQLASMRAENPTAEVVPNSGLQGPFVEVLSPNGGESYVAGSNKPLTISWRARKMPSGSTVCVLLIPTDQSSGFLWGNDGCIKAKNGVQKITSKLIRNSGYDLGPGTYSVRVTVNPKPDGSGKDLAPIAQDDSDGTITLVEDTGTDPTTPDPAGSTADSLTASPSRGSKPLLVTFSGTINAKKSCGGGNYTLAFGDGHTYEIPFPADLCRVQTFKTTHTYVKDGSYISGLYRGKLSGGDLVARRFVQVSTPQESPAQATPAGSTTSTGATAPSIPASEILVPKKEVDVLLEKSPTRQLPGAAYLAIEKQLHYLAEQVKNLIEN